MSRRTLRRAASIAIGLVTVATLTAGLGVSAQAEESPEDPGDLSTVSVAQDDAPTEVPVESREEVLGDQWDNSSDVAVVATGDGVGFRIQVARESAGYAWSTVATLAAEGVETDRWIGNYCVTADARYVAAVFGARTMVNSQSLFNRGGYGAIVNVESGEVSYLGQGFSLAYYSPSCGSDQNVVFASYADENAATRLIRVSATDPADRTIVEAPTQLTSPVLTDDGLVAVAGSEVVAVDESGSLTPVTSAEGTAFGLTADSTGALTFLDTDGTDAKVKYLSELGGEAATLAEGPLQDVGVTKDANGDVYITGSAERKAELPKEVELLDVPADAQVSSEGGLALFDVAVPTSASTSVPEADAPTAVKAIATETQKSVTFAAPAAAPAAQSMSTSAMSTTSTSPWGTSSATDAVESERACAVPRNDPNNQVIQPKPRQVEWAVDQAVKGVLTGTRPANQGIPSFSPQGIFPRPTLAGGGEVPAQVMLGVLAQESNLWQASRYTTPGVTGNPLIGNFYGVNRSGSEADLWNIDFSKADCGYGVAQVTDGMRLSGREDGGVTAYPYWQQRAIAVDYTANVAKGLQILGDKWNQTRNGGLTINNGDPAMIENWFFAVWAYNTGFYPNKGNGEPWGVGWANNPANPVYPQNRGPFLDGRPQDAANPQRWPYPEKVMGFAAHSLELYEDATTAVPGFRTAYWLATDNANGEVNRFGVKPPLNTFCKASNNCSYGTLQQPADGDPPGPCLHKNAAGAYDLKCWYNGNATWKANCDDTCGREFIRFDPGWAEQANANSFPPNCSTSGLPSGSQIVDNLPSSQAVVRSGCSKIGTTGSFSLAFGADTDGTRPSKSDFHQLGAGFNGHFYFAHTRSPAFGLYGGKMRVTGTWSLGQSLSNKWTRVMVHMPDHGAWTQQAVYNVSLGNGTVKRRVVPQQHFANKWVSLGVFQMNGTPSVSLSNETLNGTGFDDVAWDAVAFQQLTAKPTDFVVAMGDSFSSGEGSSATDGSDFYKDSDKYGSDPMMQNACHRSTKAWPLKLQLPNRSSTNKARFDSWDPSMDFQFIACSGAQTENVLPSTVTNADGEAGRGQYGELSQIDRNFLDENTTLVTISIGGNDAQFSPIFQQCILTPPGSVTSPNYCKDTTLAGDSSKLETAEKTRVQVNVKNSITTTLQQIKAKAPNAKILLMGYPKLFETGSTCVLIADHNRTWLNEVATDLGNAMQTAANNVTTASRPVKYVDPNTVFTGKNLCTSNPAVNGFMNPATPGEAPLVPITVPGQDYGLYISAQTIHPNDLGTSLYAQVARSGLTGVY